MRDTSFKINGLEVKEMPPLAAKYITANSSDSEGICRIFIQYYHIYLSPYETNHTMKFVGRSELAVVMVLMQDAVKPTIWTSRREIYIALHISSIYRGCSLHMHVFVSTHGRRSLITFIINSATCLFRMFFFENRTHKYIYNILYRWCVYIITKCACASGPITRMSSNNIYRVWHIIKSRR